MCELGGWDACVSVCACVSGSLCCFQEWKC